MFVGAEQANLVRNNLINETIKRFLVNVGNDAGDYVALALYRANDYFLAASATMRPWSRSFLCLFFALPPTKVSSISTTPTN